jgi:hypothetical protein
VGSVIVRACGATRRYDLLQQHRAAGPGAEPMSELVKVN